MNTLIAYKFRLKPNKNQIQYFSECFGSSRFLWNEMLEDTEKYFKETGKFLNIKSYKKYKRDFMNSLDSTLCNNVLRYFRQSYKNFFNSGFGKPRFKSKKDSRDSYTSNNINDSIKIKGNFIRLPKIGYVKAKIHKPLDKEDIIKNATVSKDPDGKYYISLICETSRDYTLEPNTNSIGIDLGIQYLYTDSNGNKVENPKFLKKSLKKIKFLQKSISRKKKNSRNYEKARIKLAKEYTKVKNRRKDYLNKISKQLINENQVICLESLSVKDICSSKKSNSNFRRAAYDAGLGMFISMLVYKSKLYGRTIRTVPKYFPSSQVCSSCGSLHPEMKNLGNKQLVCKDCGTIIDRDYNAAINILKNAK